MFRFQNRAKELHSSSVWKITVRSQANLYLEKQYITKRYKQCEMTLFSFFYSTNDSVSRKKWTGTAFIYGNLQTAVLYGNRYKGGTTVISTFFFHNIKPCVFVFNFLHVLCWSFCSKASSNLADYVNRYQNSVKVSKI